MLFSGSKCFLATFLSFCNSVTDIICLPGLALGGGGKEEEEEEEDKEEETKCVRL